MDIVVKDAHATGRNLLASDLPVGVRLLRGWSGHPFMMMSRSVMPAASSLRPSPLRLYTPSS